MRKEVSIWDMRRRWVKMINVHYRPDEKNDWCRRRYKTDDRYVYGIVIRIRDEFNRSTVNYILDVTCFVDLGAMGNNEDWISSIHTCPNNIVRIGPLFDVNKRFKNMIFKKCKVIVPTDKPRYAQKKMPGGYWSPDFQTVIEPQTKKRIRLSELENDDE